MTGILDHAFFKYALRWRLEYQGGVRSRVGLWMDPGHLPEHQAWRQCKEGVTRALIEGRSVLTGEVRVMAECAGENFCLFKWLAIHALEMSPSGRIGAGRSRIYGLRIVTRDEHADVYANGEAAASPRPADDKDFHYAAFGR